MKTAADFRMSDINRPNRSYTVFSEARLIEVIGDDLRAYYADVAVHSAPSELLRLAALIDKKRTGADAGE